MYIHAIPDVISVKQLFLCEFNNIVSAFQYLRNYKNQFFIVLFITFVLFYIVTIVVITKFPIIMISIPHFY